MVPAQHPTPSHTGLAPYWSQHSSVRILRNYLCAVKRDYPQVNLVGISAQVGVPYAYWFDLSNWVSVGTAIALIEALEEATGSKTLDYDAGVIACDRENLGSIYHSFLALSGTPERIFSQLPDHLKVLSKVMRGQMLRQAPGCFEVEFLFDRGRLSFEESAKLLKNRSRWMRNTVGTLEAIPQIFRLPRALVKVEEIDSSAGDPKGEVGFRLHCTYRTYGVAHLLRGGIEPTLPLVGALLYAIYRQSSSALWGNEWVAHAGFLFFIAFYWVLALRRLRELERTHVEAFAQLMKANDQYRLLELHERQTRLHLAGEQLLNALQEILSRGLVEFASAGPRHRRSTLEELAAQLRESPLFAAVGLSIVDQAESEVLCWVRTKHGTVIPAFEIVDRAPAAFRSLLRESPASEWLVELVAWDQKDDDTAVSIPPGPPLIGWVMLPSRDPSAEASQRATESAEYFKKALSLIAVQIRAELSRQQGVELDLARHQRRLAQSIAHDIQSPLETLAELVNSPHLSDQDVRFQLKPVLNRIRRMNDYWSIPTSLPSSQPVLLLQGAAIQASTAALVLEKSHSSLAPIQCVWDPSLLTPHGNDTSGFLLDLDQWNRILSNLIDNSRQANAKSLTLRLTVEGGSYPGKSTALICTLEDDGDGISPQHLSSLFQFGFTTKSTGHGIALSSARTEVNRWGGELTVKSILGQGTRIGIRVPGPQPHILDHSAEGATPVVLVDDDALVRLRWRLAAAAAKANFRSFECAEALYPELSQLPCSTMFYLDYDLGVGDTGAQLAYRLSAKGYTCLTLNTAYPEESYGQEIVDIPIRRVSGKVPPWPDSNTKAAPSPW